MNNNFYNQNPYGYGNYYQPQYQQQIQQPQQAIIPMTYVNGLEGAKAYWMATNSIAYLRDNNDDSILYEKKTDGLGKFQIKGFKLTELQVDNTTNTFKTQNSQDSIKALESKIDAIYSILAPKNEVKANEQQ
jgi:hypothetical protein